MEIFIRLTLHKLFDCCSCRCVNHRIHTVHYTHCLKQPTVVAVNLISTRVYHETIRSLVKPQVPSAGGSWGPGGKRRFLVARPHTVIRNSRSIDGRHEFDLNIFQRTFDNGNGKCLFHRPLYSASF
jgi:hypothetical protein